MIIKFLLGVFLCELIVELIIKSEIFEPITGFFKQRRENNKFFWYTGGILSCGYCFSVYVGVVASLLLGIKLFGDFSLGYGTVGLVVDLLLSGLIVHRSSNVWHNILDKYTNKFYDLRFRRTDDVLMEDMNNG